MLPPLEKLANPSASVRDPDSATRAFPAYRWPEGGARRGKAEDGSEARAEAEVAARFKQQAAMAEAAAQAAIVEAAAAAAAAAAEPIVPAERNAAAQQMMAMGFGDQALVMAALAQHSDDIAAAVAQLLR